MTTYAEKLKRPEWQMKRLKIMEAAGGYCQNCGMNDVTLNVHHIYYIPKRNPWDYPDDALQCLCEYCHAEQHSKQTRLLMAISGGNAEYDQIIGFVDAVSGRPENMRKAHAPCSYVDGYARGLMPVDLYDALRLATGGKAHE